MTLIMINTFVAFNMNLCYSAIYLLTWCAERILNLNLINEK